MLMGMDAFSSTAATITFALDFVAHAEDTVGGSPITFTGISFGTADTNRIIAVPVCWRANADGDTITGMTIGGVSATQASGAYVSATGGAWISDIWYAAVPTGTSGNVVVTFSATTSRTGIATYRIITGTSTPTSVQNTSGNGTVISKAITINSGGKGLAFFSDRIGSGTNIVWTNATSDYNALTVGTFSDISGANVSASATVSADNTPLNTFSTLVLAAWAL